jgi:hypothetical protein
MVRPPTGSIVLTYAGQKDDPVGVREDRLDGLTWLQRRRDERLDRVRPPRIIIAVLLR